MASIKKNHSKEVPSVSTASLPDIIFTLLFFFMVSAKVKDTPPKVEQINPEAVDPQKLSKQDIKTTIWIGQAKNTSLYSGTVIQLGGKIITTDRLQEVSDYVRTAMLETPYQFRSDFILTVKADKGVESGLVRKVLAQARKGNPYENFPLRVSLESDEKVFYP